MRSDQALHYLLFSYQIEHTSTGGQLDLLKFSYTGPPSTVGNVSGYISMSDSRFRGEEFDPRSVPKLHGD